MHSFTLAVIEELERHLSKHEQLQFAWSCLYCRNEHKGDLLKRVRAVSIDEDDKKMVHLKTEAGNLFGVISISKNKKINQELADKYKALGVIFIQISRPSGSENVIDSLSKPRFVNSCFNPKCKTCGNFQMEKSMFIIDSFCWKCEGPMKVAVIEFDGFHFGPDRFSNEELTLARSKGAKLQNNYSKTMAGSYMSNTCPRCDALTGDHYLFTDHYTEAIYGNLKYEQISQGYHCGCNDE